MTIDTPTPSGGETDSSVESAAARIEGLLGAPEPPKTDETPTAEAAEPTNNDGQQPEEAEAKEGTSETESDAQNDTQFETLDQLAEATGLPLETILNLKARTNVDGQESVVPIAEVIKSYQLSKHVNNQSQELANQRKALDAEREKSTKELQQSLTQAQALSNALEQNLMAEYQAVDWTTMRNVDPAEFAARKQEYNERWNYIQGMKQHALTESFKIQQDAEKKQSEKIKEIIQTESGRLVDAIPEWRDSNRQKTEKLEISSYLKSNNFTDEEIGSIIDHRHVKMIRNSMLYEKSSKKATLEQKKVVNLPKVLKPGNQSSKNARSEKAQESMSRLQKSGKLQDAADAILQRMK